MHSMSSIGTSVHAWYLPKVRTPSYTHTYTSTHSSPHTNTILPGSLSRSQTTVIFINQLRSKIGVMYGNPEVTAGGNALKFYSSVRIDIRRKEILKENDGIMVKIKVVKNKVRNFL
jgi:RecA/RadA recombinase